MFGYLLPDKQELKVKDYALFRAAYCGVCRCIKLHYGELPRFAVSYDAAVLAVLLIGASGGEPVARKRVCALNPLKGKPVYEGHAALDYAAAISVMLASARLRDAWADERRILALPALTCLHAADRKARQGYPVPATLIDRCLADLALLEKAKCDQIDRPADAMGNMMSGMATSGPSLDPAARVLLQSMGYHLGRWIYLVDALDDMAKDKKAGAYNPILASGGGSASEELARNACLYAASQAAAVFDLMEFEWGYEVVRNVLYAGMPKAFERATNKENDRNDRSVEGAWGQAELKR